MNLFRPPWSLSEEEFKTVVRRGNRYTHYGIEYAQQWWFSWFILVGPFAFLVLCWYTSR